METLLISIDGRNLYYIFLAGAQKIFQHQDEINDINVFPVTDHDTGTNLAATFRAITTTLKPQTSIKETANLIAEAALVGARGNSGIIFAQFLYGFSSEIENKSSLNFIEFARGIRRSIDLTYQAVSNPVEGTMLTVIREWAEYLYEKKEIFSDFKIALTESMEVLHRSLQETKKKLGVLSKNDVVDAGAKGFFLFIEGIMELLKGANLRQLRRNATTVPNNMVHEESIVESEISYRYCTEGLIKDIVIEKEQLNSILNNFGDSAVIAGSSRLRRFHVHTDQPAKLFDNLRDSGTLVFQKADDMRRQHEIVHDRKWPIAIVTDSTCDLDETILDKYQIHILPINILFGENHYLDKVTIKPEQFYHLLDRSPEFPTTAQVNEASFTELYERLASHYESVIAVHLTGKFSGTFESSLKAAGKVSEKTATPIHVADSKNLSGALGLLVLRIARAIEEGESYARILASLNSWIANTKILVSVQTLDYMVRGGRVSYTKGKIAKWLNINPIVSMNSEGASELFDKAFSQKSNMIKVMRTIKKDLGSNRIWNYIILHAQNPGAAGWYENEMRKLTGHAPISVVNISPVIGMNAGIGSASVAYMLE